MKSALLLLVLTALTGLTGMPARAQTPSAVPPLLPAPANSPPIRTVPALKPVGPKLPRRCAVPADVACVGHVADKPSLQSAETEGVRPPLIRKPKMRPQTPAPTITLDATAKQALMRSRKWQQDENRPTAGDDGRVMYTFGAGMPVVVCAPLRICVIELQPGEHVNKEVQLGDSVRWLVTPAESGSGARAQTLVVIKPKEAGLDTNLMIPTDRRNYYVRLVSQTTAFVARIAFIYPEDARQAWEAHGAKRAGQTRNDVAPEMSPASIDRIRFDYTIEGNAGFKPVRVLDNGEKTYIQLPPSSRFDEIPVLVLLNADGKEQLVNSRFVNGWFEVDRLFDRAALILGVGSNQRKVVIINNARIKPRAFSTYGSDLYGG